MCCGVHSVESTVWTRSDRYSIGLTLVYLCFTLDCQYSFVQCLICWCMLCIQILKNKITPRVMH